jgi:hypothetical protein
MKRFAAEGWIDGQHQRREFDAVDFQHALLVAGGLFNDAVGIVIREIAPVALAAE